MPVDCPVISDRLLKKLHGLLCGEVAQCVLFSGATDRIFTDHGSKD